MQGIHSGYGSGLDSVPDPDLESGSGFWIQEFQRGPPGQKIENEEISCLNELKILTESKRLLLELGGHCFRFNKNVLRLYSLNFLRTIIFSNFYS